MSHHLEGAASVHSGAAPSASSVAPEPAAAPRSPRRRRLLRSLPIYLLVLPAALFYGVFVLRPIALTAQFSLYDWNGIEPATWVGLANYVEVFTEPKLVGSILNAFELILYFSFVPVILALFAANVIRGIATSRLAGIARTVLFLPQVIPLVAAGIMWTWQFASNGMVNELLRAVGLGGLARAWLGDFDTALPAVRSSEHGSRWGCA